MNERGHLDLNGRTILVTGSPGFIGAALVMRLLKEMDAGHVISFDNMNDYYDPALKYYRLSRISALAEKTAVRHTFIKGDIADRDAVEEVFREYRPTIVVNLAAQAGVRYSIEKPEEYIRTNITGFLNIQEAVRHSSEWNEIKVDHFVYASSSSVYGNSRKTPFSVEDRTDQPVSLYAATKKSDELMAYSYAKLFGIPSTGLRFFTVYGPAGRPDMFCYKLIRNLAEDKDIEVYNYGNCLRDFTYIDDIVEGLYRVLQNPPDREDAGPENSEQVSSAVYNIGGGNPVKVNDMISAAKEAIIQSGMLPTDHDFDRHIHYTGMQPGDVLVTCADTEGFETRFGFVPATPLRTGLLRFIEWYRDYTDHNGGKGVGC